MALPSNTLTTYAQIGRREDLSDLTDDISPTDRPFMQMIGRGVAKNTRTEWQMSSLRAAAANRVLSGDDVTLNTTLQPQRLHAFTQISDEAAVIAGSAEDGTVLAGRSSEMARAKARKMEELLNDIEFMLTNRAGVATPTLPAENSAGSAGAVRSTAAFQTWMGVNTSNRGTSGAAAAGTSSTVAQPNDDAQITDASAPNMRDFTESIAKDVLQKTWTMGGRVKNILLGPVNRVKASAFTGNATRTIDAKGRALTAAVDLYSSDWGEHNIVASHFSAERDGLFIDPAHWELRWYRPMFGRPLGVSGDNDKYQIVCEYALAALNPWSSGIAADLLTT